MPLKSMTGFARADGAHGLTRWHWELKSVNGRGLDVRCRLPQGFEVMEQETRRAVSSRLVRGNCQVGLTVTRGRDANGVRINRDMLAQVVSAANALKDEIDAAPPSLDGLMAIRGVVETAEPEETEEDRNALFGAILDSFQTALDSLSEMREAEGGRLRGLLCGHIDEIERLTDAARSSPARTAEAIRRRLAEQVESLLEASSSIDPDRLHQEAVLLAAKADIQEEVDRLDAHVTVARELLSGDEPAGRKLDFLAQEFNREANTLCSKSNDTSITTIGMEMKVIIDQMKEQVQNIE